MGCVGRIRAWVCGVGVHIWGRKRERERGRVTHTDRQIDRQTDRNTENENIHRNIEIKKYLYTCATDQKEIGRHTKKQKADMDPDNAILLERKTKSKKIDKQKGRQRRREMEREI